MRLMILEDNAERRTAMLEHVADCLPMFAVAFYDSSVAMINAIRRNGLREVSLVSLDNDLEPLGYDDGNPIDAGDGVSVADFLADSVSGNDVPGIRRVPVVVHSSNESAASQMMDSLLKSGWDAIQIVPFDAERWIGETWIRVVRRKIVSAVTERATSARSG